MNPSLEKRILKHLLPADASSAELDLLHAAIRQRSIYSARTTNLSYLELISDLIDRVMSGDLDTASMRVEMLSAIRQTGYDPEAHGITKGSLEDLSSAQRINLIIDTQAKQAAGYAQFVSANDPIELDLYPCQEFVRHASRKIERQDWPQRWRSAGGHFYGPSRDRMIARKDDPVWTALSRFGSPWPPFDFNSGMGLDPIPREEAEELGLITSREIPTPQRIDFNQAVSVPVDPQTSPALRQAIEDTFGPITDGHVTIQPKAQNRALKINTRNAEQPRQPAGSPEGGQFAPQNGAASSSATTPPPRLTVKEADAILTKGITETTASGQSVKFGQRLKQKLESKPEYAGRKELLEWGREAVRTGHHTQHEDNNETRDYYAKVFGEGRKGVLVIVDTKDGEAFNIFASHVSYLKKHKYIENSSRRAEQGEQPPLGVMQDIAAAGILPDCHLNTPANLVKSNKRSK